MRGVVPVAREGGASSVDDAFEVDRGIGGSGSASAGGEGKAGSLPDRREPVELCGDADVWE